MATKVQITKVQTVHWSPDIYDPLNVWQQFPTFY